jgi:uncharacterized protein YyaL (SSP411 family)
MMTDRFHFSPRPNRAREIAWRAWGPGSFAEAQREGKPVLLSLSAVWCHWCHVMDETSYSDSGVIARVNEHFIPIRVDADERPDVNSRYNLGGWPTTAFLTSDGFLLGGATYVPPQSMRPLLDDVARAWSEQGVEIRERIAQRSASLGEEERPPEGAIGREIVATTLDAIVDVYDQTYGGFGHDQKFPHTGALALLLLQWELREDERAKEMLVTTLRAMALGGMYDNVEGGFFRYSTTPDWSVPHFEKMLEDHGGLLPLYARAWRLTGDAELRTAPDMAIAYLRATLRDPQSGFFGGSQDADEEYFALPLDERGKREAPYVDRTIYANWNAAIASAFLRCARDLDRPELAVEALQVLDGIDAAFLDARGVCRHFRRPGEQPELPGLLTDQAAYLRALLDAHEWSGEARFYERAAALADAIEAAFVQSDGAYADHANGAEAVAMIRFLDRPLPDNALVADSLLRLAAMSADAAWHARAERILRALTERYAAQKYFAAPYALAVERYLAHADAIALVGSPDATAALRRAALALPDPLLSLTTIASGSERAAARGFTAGVTPLAYACRGTACSPPESDPARLTAPSRFRA